MKAIPEGARIVCSSKFCGLPIFEFVKELKLGEHLSLDHLTPLRPDALKSVETCTCPSCGAFYMDNGAIHCQFGWFPYPP
jgi:hypothetical protein